MRLFVFCLALYCSHLSFSQKVEIATGMGSPETLHLSVRALSLKVIWGAGYGFLPGYDQSLRTLTFDVGFPYGKIAKNSDSKRSQFRFAVISYREETDRRIFKYTYLGTRAGRNHFFSQRAGIGWEAGFVFKIIDKEEVKDNMPGSFDFVADNVLPSLSVRFFYRL